MLPIRNDWRLIRIGVIAGLVFCGVGGNSSQPALLAAPVDRTDVKGAEPILFPDGVIDTQRRTAFVSSPKGGIQAIRLEDGKVLWTNDDCTAQPWLVAGQRLITRGDRVVILDIKNDGKLLRQCDALTYPKVKVPDRCTVSFHLWGPHVAGDTLEANWYAVAYIDRSKGRPFNFPAWTTFNRGVPVGIVRINLDTGRTEVRTDEKTADVTGTLILDAAKPEHQMPAGLPEKLAAVWQQYHKEQNGRIMALDGRLVGVSMILEMAGAEYLKKVVLNSWDLKTGAPDKPVELIKDKALAIANILLTGDRRHAGVQFSTSALTLYSLPDGKEVAREVKGVFSPENAFVDGKRLYHVKQPGGGSAQTLEAIDLESGKALWGRPLKPRITIPLPP
jgi:hypothetical protein